MNIPNVYLYAINFVLAVLQQSVLTWLLQKYTMIITSGVYAQFFAHNLEYRLYSQRRLVTQLADSKINSAMRKL